MSEGISPMLHSMNMTDGCRNNLGVVEVAETIGQVAWLEYVVTETDMLEHRLKRYGEDRAKFLASFDKILQKPPDWGERRVDASNPDASDSE